jgi:hypothetical protein
VVNDYFTRLPKKTTTVDNIEREAVHAASTEAGCCDDVCVCVTDYQENLRSNCPCDM